MGYFEMRMNNGVLNWNQMACLSEACVNERRGDSFFTHAIMGARTHIGNSLFIKRPVDHAETIELCEL